MSEEAQQKDAPESKSKLKVVIPIAAILLIEAVVIVGAMMLFGGPPEVEASGGLADMEMLEDEMIEELLVLDARLPNNKTGVTYVYDAEIFVQVRRKHATRVNDELDRFRNEIRADMVALWRTSEPHHFQEPRLENLTRKVHAFLNDRFGVDPESGDPIVEKVVIVMGTGFRIDS